MDINNEKHIIICMDIDDSLFPSIQTHIGIVKDNNKIFKLNINRISKLIQRLETLEFRVSVCIIGDLISSLDLVDNKLKFKGDYHKKLYSKVVKRINKKLGKYLVKDYDAKREVIIKYYLDNQDTYVIALDDIDLSNIVNDRYLYVPVYTFLTNRNLYAINNFIKNSIIKNY